MVIVSHPLSLKTAVYPYLKNYFWYESAKSHEALFPLIDPTFPSWLTVGKGVSAQRDIDATPVAEFSNPVRDGLYVSGPAAAVARVVDAAREELPFDELPETEDVVPEHKPSLAHVPIPVELPSDSQSLPIIQIKKNLYSTENASSSTFIQNPIIPPRTRDRKEKHPKIPKIKEVGRNNFYKEGTREHRLRENQLKKGRPKKAGSTKGGGVPNPPAAH
jgi:hypothetical protein